jgi:hypothetical protein
VSVALSEFLGVCSNLLLRGLLGALGRLLDRPLVASPVTISAASLSSSVSPISSRSERDMSPSRWPLSCTTRFWRKAIYPRCRMAFITQ